ncbi:SH3 domain-containing protein [Stappia indica]|uniref:SH3 domain-containing protein n=1 Tax=Stappia indica TaxID=538381 RepID=A0A857C4D6_9HYPH|nr:SH3 domain-containing protein [Stappia indica]QGZ33754.1 hypothetical protein GH266_04065 [Stappia indica]
MIRCLPGLAAGALMLGIVPAHAEGRYEHNGSIMLISQDRNTVRIVYETPRPGLVSQGVRPGTVLFEGQLNADSYLEGMSRIFRPGCDIDYFVYGDYRPAGDLALSGAAPVLAPSGCRIVNNVHEGPNANLVFSYLGPARGGARPSGPAANQPAAPARPVAGLGPFCVSGISSTLNMRAGPGTQFGVVGTLDADRCGLAGYGRCQDGWCFVADRSAGPSGAMGWVSSQYLRAR